MWRPKQLILENFLTFPFLEYKFEAGRAILVVGRNLDDSGQRGNGAGKSSLNEAISIAITGTSIRDCKSRELVRRGCDETKLIFELFNVTTQETMKITRRLFKKESTSSTCQIELSTQEKPVDTCSDINAYNAFILKKIGISKEDFFYYFLVTKELFKPFLSTGDTEKKQIINRFSGANVIDKVDPFVSKDIEECEKKIKITNESILRNSTKSQLLSEQLQTLREENSDVKKSEKIGIKLGEITNQNDKITLIIKQIDTENLTKDSLEEQTKELLVNKPKYDVEKEIINTNIQSYTKRMNELNELSKNVVQEFQTEVNEIKETEEQCKTELDTLKQTFDSTKKQLKFDYDEKINKSKTQKATDVKNKEDLENKLAGAIKCPKCSHEFTLRYGDFNVEAAQKSVHEFTESIALLEIEIRDCEEEYKQKLFDVETTYNNEKKELDDIVSQLDEQKNQVNEKIKEKRKVFNEEHEEQNKLLVTQRGTLTKIEEEERTYNKVISTIDEKIEKCNLNIKSYNTSISQIELNIKLIESQIEQLDKSTDTGEKEGEYEKQIEVLIKEDSELRNQLETQSTEKRSKEEWLTNFKNFKSFLANQSIKNIADYTNYYLNSIQSNITIQIDGYRMLAGGKKLKEEITTTVFKDGFEEGSYGTFSAGERGRIIICNILGLQELINLNAGVGKGLDLLICDEILDSIDTLGLELLMDALQNLQKTILIISQNEINSLSSCTIIIQKKNKTSTILENG